MLEAAKIKENIRLYGPHNSFNVEDGDAWGLHNQLREGVTSWEPCSERSVIPGQHASNALVAQLHMQYRCVHERYEQLWTAYLAHKVPLLSVQQRKIYGIGGARGAPIGRGTFNPAGMVFMRAGWSQCLPYLTGVQVQPNDAQLVREWQHQEFVFYSSIRLNQHFDLKQDQWVLSRHVESGEVERHGVPKCMWFGRVKSIFTHKLYSAQKAFLHVEWHKTVNMDGCAFDANLQSPVIHDAVDHSEISVVPVEDIFPLHIACDMHHSQPKCLVLSTRSWHVLSAVGINVPWPKLFMYPERGEGEPV